MIALAAMSLNRTIGKDGKIPWYLPSDLKWFKKSTLGKTVVMGRVTFNTMPYLPNRNIIVLGRGKIQSPVIGRYEPHELRFVSSIDLLPKNCIVAGGAKVYESLLPHCEALYLTLVKQEVEGDTLMPAFEHLFTESELIEDDAEKSIVKYYK